MFLQLSCFLIWSLAHFLRIFYRYPYFSPTKQAHNLDFCKKGGLILKEFESRRGRAVGLLKMFFIVITYMTVKGSTTLSLLDGALREWCYHNQTVME